MNILLRYACLLGLGFASLFSMISAGTVTGQVVMARSDAALVHQQDMNIWVLGVVTLVSVFSVVRFVFARMPLAIRDCYRDHKDKLATLLMAGIVCFVFVVF